MENRNMILVVGGYGAVGGIIVSQLAQIYPNEIYIAGRSLEKAQRFCRQHEINAKPIQLDVSKPVNVDQLSDIRLVIMCIEQEKTDFVEHCLREGIHYIDITASYSFISEIEAFQALAVRNQSAAVLSVGFAPGLTNLIAMNLAKQFTLLESLHTTIILGTGDSHGQAAIYWMLDQLNDQYDLVINRSHIRVRNFTRRRNVLFEKLGKRSAYLFNFSDQHTLKKHFSKSEITTRLALDSSWLNQCIHLLHQLRITRLLKSNVIKKWIGGLVSNIKVGTDVCAIKVEANGVIDGHHQNLTKTIYASNEAYITACVAVKTARNVLTEAINAGVYHIEELYELKEYENMIKNLSESKSSDIKMK